MVVHCVHDCWVCWCGSLWESHCSYYRSIICPRTYDIEQEQVHSCTEAYKGVIVR